MPARKKSPVKETVAETLPEEVSVVTKKRFSFPKLKLPQSFDYTPLLVIGMIVGAFFLGRMSAQIQYMQNGGAPTAQQAAQQPSVVGQNPQAAGQQAPAQKQNVTNGHFPALGNANAKVVVIEFADFRCPFCEQFATNTYPQLKKDYIDTGKIAFYFRQFPFLGPASNVAADAAECAQDQNKFWAMHDWLYQNQPAETDTSLYATDKLTAAATSLGMDGTQFSNCLSNKSDDARSQTDYQDGQKAGVSGTPTFFINGTPLVGAQPYDAFKAAIDAELKK